ncbi:hypothetical protein COU75_03580 [Candidatus Peregrinibacteria bacterium CG10_big_fil_rev_8_21_14_0_10_42_8]|nr:MAG: hypothetical protein COU75_03580 [Candidatus Peregrinibacteria bacterium CG10_big_fil_rev_8_21_14_0_10_42_8]
MLRRHSVVLIRTLGLLLLAIGLLGLIFLPKPGIVILIAGFLITLWCSGNEQRQQREHSLEGK